MRNRPPPMDAFFQALLFEPVLPEALVDIVLQFFNVGELSQLTAVLTRYLHASAVQKRAASALIQAAESRAVAREYFASAYRRYQYTGLSYWPEKLRSLVASSSVRVNNERLLMEAGRDIPSVSFCRVLLAAKADPAAQDRSTGFMPLHYAAASGHFELVQCFLAQAPDLAKADAFHGWQPLHYAVQSGSLPVVQLLLAHGADMHATCKKGESPRSLAVGNGALVELFTRHEGNTLGEPMTKRIKLDLEPEPEHLAEFCVPLLRSPD